MPRTHMIKASEMFEPVEIELWDGSMFRLREATTSVEDKVTAKQTEINQLSEKAAPEERELTALQRKITELWENKPGSPEIEKLEEEAKDKRAEVEAKESKMEDALPFLIDMLDILLEPLTPALDENSEQIEVPAEVRADGKPKAGTEMVAKMVTAEDSIKAALADDVIGISHIDALSKKLNETAMEARPT